MDEYFSLEIPQVKDPLKAVKELKSSFVGAVHTADSLAAVEKLNLGPSQKFLLIVELSPSSDLNDEEQTIASNGMCVCLKLCAQDISY